jgi:hypothetical protein
MPAAIEFNGELCSVAVEVEDVRGTGMLAAEMIPAQALIAQ